MPTRLLKESICTSKDINRLTPEQEVFFYRLIVNCDDHGYFQADPDILRGRCFPRRIDLISPAIICQWLQALVIAKMVTVFESGENFYLCLPSWDGHQQVRAKRHKYPVLDDSCRILLADDITCNHLLADDCKCARNPIQSNPDDIQSNPNPIHQSTVVGFEEFWKAYPKKVGKQDARKAFGKIKPDGVLLEKMVKSLELVKRTDQWQKGFIPDAAKWLHGKRWEDEIREGGKNDRTPIDGYTDPATLFDPD